MDPDRRLRIFTCTNPRRLPGVRWSFLKIEYNSLLNLITMPGRSCVAEIICSHSIKMRFPASPSVTISQLARHIEAEENNLKLLSIVLALATSGTAFALQCGDTVSGNVTLMSDLVCVNQSGLKVSADNTFIHLNGHSIVCTGAGFAGSCQDPVGGPISGLPVGIFSLNHDHVVVEGPGKIEGFAYGVELDGGKGLSVHQVSITGPAVPLSQNQRGLAIGIFMRNIGCRDNSPFTPE